MPDGRVMRIDADRDCVYVIRRGRSYEAPLAEVETAARVPSARVRFNLRRSNGVESAENVTLRAGTRTNRRQRRFGDLTGARSPGSKVKTSAQKEFGIDVTTQPFRVVRAWIQAVSQRDLDSAASLYLPSAVVYTPEGAVGGRARIRALLDESSWIEHDPDHVELHGMDQYVQAYCPDHEDLTTTFMIIEGGQIAEQWLGLVPDFDHDETAAPALQVLRKGDVDAKAVDYANHRLEHLADSLGRPIGLGLVKLTQASNPAVEKPAMAEASLDVDGTFVRAHIAARTMTEAIDLVIGRLKAKLDHHKDNRKHRKGSPDPAEWRHGNMPSTNMPYFDRPRQEREVVRHKSFAPDEMTVEEAAWDMAQLDYDFFLFVELTTGLDCLLERADDGAPLVIHGLVGDNDGVSSDVVGIEFSDEAPPALKLSAAIEFLDAAGSRFVFFQNTATDRRNVVYRRYDGHYGLITPPTSNSDNDNDNDNE